MSELLHVIDELIAGGLYPALPGRKAAVWKDGRNVTFMEDSAQAGLGQFGYFYTETIEPITGLKMTQIASAPVIYFGTNTALKFFDTVVEDRSKAGGYNGTDSDLWQFARWGEFMVASNGVDKIQVDENDTNGFLDLAGQPFTYAKCIAATDTHLLAANTSLGANWVGWTDLDDIEEWTAAADNDAGSKYLRNIDSDIISVKKRGDGFALFTYNEMYAIDYIGSPYVFGIRELLTGFGAVGKHAVVPVGRQHYGMGRRSIWVTDGTTFQAIDAPKLHDLVYGDSEHRFDQTRGHQVIAWHDQLQDSVVFFYPRVGSVYNDFGVSYNYKTGAVSLYNYGRTIVDDSGILRFALTGDELGNIYQQSVTAVPPQAGQHGRVLVDDAEATLTTGFSMIGFGEFGFGGVLYVTG